MASYKILVLIGITLVILGIGMNFVLDMNDNIPHNPYQGTMIDGFMTTDMLNTGYAFDIVITNFPIIGLIFIVAGLIVSMQKVE